VTGELFKMITGINMLHVPYRGSGPLVTDLLRGQMHVAFDTLPSSLEHIRSSKLRALAVTTVTRSEALPEVPTGSSSVPDYEASYLNGVVVPINTSNEIIEKLNGEINAALADN
jgi:tripartite-type tricarboxylate transporter receptor subunit TctC